MTVKTDVIFFDKDIGKNLYRKKTYYTVCIEQDVLAKDKDEAEQLFLDGGGIDYDQMRTNLTDQNNGVETYSLDCNYTESEDTEYLGKVTPEYDDDVDTTSNPLGGTPEIIDTYIDEYADEVVNEKALNDYVKEQAEQNG